MGPDPVSATERKACDTGPKEGPQPSLSSSVNLELGDDSDSVPKLPRLHTAPLNKALKRPEQNLK